MKVFPASFFVVALAFASILPAAAWADAVKVIVNGIPITSSDIAHRAAFLRLQRRKGVSAKEDMIEQALRQAEEKRLGVNVTDQQVEQAYDGFAKKNKLNLKQLALILNHAGVTPQHFKQFLRVQIGWGEALRARFRAESSADTADVVRQMLEKGEKKPSAMEYRLQQVIFVIPARDRKAIYGKRKQEAEALRSKFQNCDSTYGQAKGMIDVTIRDLGLILAPELPPDWADDVKKTKVGGTTPLHDTPRGLEYLAICSGKEVSDDRVAEMVLQTKGDQSKVAEKLNEKYIGELKKKAHIIER